MSIDGGIRDVGIGFSAVVEEDANDQPGRAGSLSLTPLSSTFLCSQSRSSRQAGASRVVHKS